MNLEQLREKIEQAGVIGAGGAGFPTHMKLSQGIDTVLVNASECEPLLYTDFMILRESLDQVLAGAQALCEALGAKQVVIGMKNHMAVKLGFSGGETLNSLCRVTVLPDVYPMGDEVILIYQALKRIVPPGQLPASVGVVVINAETAYNVCNAMLGIPVTHKWLTVGGAVKNPCVVRVPINCEVKNLFKSLGEVVSDGFVVLDGGPAMGNIVNPLTAHVTKKTKALIVLPDTIPAVTSKTAPVERLIKRTSSACCQCYACTDQCPRHLLGYPIQPHKTLRAVGSFSLEHPDDLLTASLCSGCGVCTLTACCQGITPSATMTAVKRNLAKNRMGYKSDNPTKPLPDREFRMLPLNRLISRLGVTEYDKMAEFIGDLLIYQTTFTLLLSQHVGKAAIPIVNVGDKITAGQMVAKADNGISASLHSPINGTVAHITDVEIAITAGDVE